MDHERYPYYTETEHLLRRAREQRFDAAVTAAFDGFISIVSSGWRVLLGSGRDTATQR